MNGEENLIINKLMEISSQLGALTAKFEQVAVQLDAGAKVHCDHETRLIKLERAEAARTARATLIGTIVAGMAVVVAELAKFFLRR